MQPLDYLQSTTGIIWIVICGVIGFLFSYSAYCIVNEAPAKWFCDYNEEPSEELLTGRRLKYSGSGIVFSIISAICFMLCRIQFNKGYDVYFVIFSLIILTALVIAVSDFKYTIIPDQFTVVLGALSLAVSIYDIVMGYNILHQSWWSPIAGAFIGAGVMLLIDFIGMLIYKQDGMGFGDVKLFFAAGILTGFPGTIYALIISVIAAAICFIIIIIASRIIISRLSSEAENSEEKSESGETDGLEETVKSDVENKTEDGLDEIKAEEIDPEKNGDEAEIDSSVKNKSDDGKNSDNEENNEDDEEVSGNTQLAFGPYIAISVIVYITLFDFIYYISDLYLGLFK